jgi:hypothetical protein
VIDVQYDIELMKGVLQRRGLGEAQAVLRGGPSVEWQTLYREVSALLGEDPGSDQAQKVADRWLMLAVRSSAGDPDVQTDSMTAWIDRDHWPPG